MILIAATGLALSLCRAYPIFQPRGSLDWYVEVLLGPVALFAAVTGLALVPSWLRQPRLSRHRLLSRPGFVCSFALAFGLALGLWHWFFLMLKMPRVESEFVLTLFNETVWRFWSGRRSDFAIAVAAGWLAMAVLGNWRPERSWLDRLGRAIGWFWIATIFIDVNGLDTIKRLAYLFTQTSGG